MYLGAEAPLSVSSRALFLSLGRGRPGGPAKDLMAETPRERVVGQEEALPIALGPTRAQEHWPA